MRVRRRAVSIVGAVGSLLLGVAGAGPAPVFASDRLDSFIVVYASPEQVDPQGVVADGDEITADISQAGMLVVRSSHPATLSGLPGVIGVAPDLQVNVPEEQPDSALRAEREGAGCASLDESCPLQWDLSRIHVPNAWQTTQGSPAIKVAVLDTGLTSTHQEVGANYDKAESRSFVKPNGFCAKDTTTFASLEDFNGHGTWTATHVAGVNGALMTGIAPNTTLINVRVLGACGGGLFSWVINGMLYASSVGARVESMSLGGYLCADGFVPGSFYCGNPKSPAVIGGPALWQVLTNVINTLRAHGTIVVAAAANDHLQLNARGRVATNGSLAFGGVLAASPRNDARGLAEAPAGLPGVVAVGALTRVTAQGALGETRFGQYGVDETDQLTYYSNFGDRIDVSAPGGARNFNVPVFDCRSAECGRLGTSQSDANDNPGDFGAWGIDPATGALCGNCYIFVQGTSMATPQVAGVAALALAVNPELTPDGLVKLLHRSVTRFADRNATPAAASDPARPTFNWDIDYGADGVSNNLMGTGVIDAALAVKKAKDL